MNYFSKNIKFLLYTFNISRDEFASVIGKKRSVIGSYIRGEAQPNLNTLIHIANYFGININILVTFNLEEKLKNKKILNFGQLHNLLFDHDESKNEIFEMKNKTFEGKMKTNYDGKNPKDELFQSKHEQKKILNEIFLLQNRIDVLHNMCKNSNIVTKFFNPMNIGLFSILIINFIVLYIGINNIANFRIISEDDIFSKYYRPYKEDIYKDYDQRLSKVKEYYAYGNYYGVLNEFEKIVKNDSLDLTPYFYQGLVYLELGQFQSAIENFAKILLNEKSKYSDESRWYISLCYLKIGQKVKAKFYFEEILKTQRYKRNEAAEILKKLKS